MGFLTAPEEYLNRLRRILPSGGVNQFASLAIYHYSKNSLPSHIESINKILLNKKNIFILQKRLSKLKKIYFEDNIVNFRKERL